MREGDKVSKCYNATIRDEDGFLKHTFKYTVKDVVLDEGSGTYTIGGIPHPEIVRMDRVEWMDKTIRKSMPKSLRAKVYEMYGGRCSYCGKHLEPREMRVDHIIPVEAGGSDDISNLRPSCQDCNWVKTNCDTEYMRDAIQEYLRTIKRDIRYRMLLAYGLIVETGKPVEFLFEENTKCLTNTDETTIISNGG